jgi:hypothetical protein
LRAGTNVAADVGATWPQVSNELVIDRAPGGILDAGDGNEEGGRELFAALRTVPAVRDGRIVPTTSDVIYRAGHGCPRRRRSSPTRSIRETLAPCAAVSHSPHAVAVTLALAVLLLVSARGNGGTRSVSASISRVFAPGGADTTDYAIIVQTRIPRVLLRGRRGRLLGGCGCRFPGSARESPR